MTAIHGVTWLWIRNGQIALERCEKKARVLGVGEWFIPGGKVKRWDEFDSGGHDETTEAALVRELGEEWPDVHLDSWKALPILEGSAVPPGPRGLFLMRPYLVKCNGDLPATSGNGVPLRWAPIGDALDSPVVQVRMMTAAALHVMNTAPSFLPLEEYECAMLSLAVRLGFQRAGVFIGGANAVARQAIDTAHLRALVLEHPDNVVSAKNAVGDLLARYASHMRATKGVSILGEQ